MTSIADPVAHRSSTAPATRAPSAGRLAGREAPAGGPELEFLAFRLGGEEYGIDLLRVQEIRSFEKPTHIANAPAHILGVLNLRGVIVPVVDLRCKFGMGSTFDDATVTIVLSLGERSVGIVVDTVSDVVSLAAENRRPVPAMRCAIESEHLLAIGTVDGRMLILLDIQALMASPSIGLADFASC